MSDDELMRLVEEYAARTARGERPDVLAYLDRAGDDADRLADLLDAYLAMAPPVRDPDAATLAWARALVAGAEEERPLLDLRHERGLSVDAVVEALRIDLEIAADHAPRLRGRYQDLEGGRLVMERVSAGLRAALARVFGVGEAALLVHPADPSGPVFARAPEGWSPSAGLLEDVLPVAPDDTVDRLFGIEPGEATMPADRA